MAGRYPDRERVTASGAIERRCLKCDAWKDLELFAKAKRFSRGRLWRCQRCESKRVRAWHDALPSRVRVRTIREAMLLLSDNREAREVLVRMLEDQP
jgi:DNA-directed RNA polymerase subunit RPC12/RpoP